MSDDRAHDAAEMVQAAALEAIRAMKAFLDIAEAVVREPAAAATVGRAFAEAATSAFRPSTLSGETAPDDDRDAEEEHHTGRVRRIDVSD